MPRCQNCGDQWNWKTTFRKSFTMNSGMVCPNCGATQYPTKQSRQRGSFFAFLPALGIAVSNAAFGLNAWVLLLVGAVLLVIAMTAYFRQMELSNENEPMW